MSHRWIRVAVVILGWPILTVAPDAAQATQSSQSLAGQGTPPAPSTPAKGPNLMEANRAIAAAHAAAAGAGQAMSCAVVDSRGDLISIARMDGARFFTTDLARGKAVSSALFTQPSANLASLPLAVVAAMAGTGARLVLLRGAVPVMRNSQNFGAIGCSGGTGQQDEDAAKAGQQLLQAAR